MCPSQSITSASVVITFSSSPFLEPFVRASTEVHHSPASNAAPSSPLSCPPLPGDHVLTGRECSWHDLGGVGMATLESRAPRSTLQPGTQHPRPAVEMKILLDAEPLLGPA